MRCVSVPYGTLDESNVAAVPSNMAEAPSHLVAAPTIIAAVPSNMAVANMAETPQTVVVTDFNAKLPQSEPQNLAEVCLSLTCWNDRKDALKGVLENATTAEVDTFLVEVQTICEKTSLHFSKWDKQCVEQTVNELLLMAAKMGQAHIVKFLVEEKAADVKREIQSEWPIEAVAVQGHTECVKHLVNKGADVNPACWNSYEHVKAAVYCRHADCVKLLVEEGADVHPVQGPAPLAAAAKYGHIECIKLLLEHGADVNQVARSGSVPLASAMKSGNLDCVKLLLNHGADVNYGGLKGATPLMEALGLGNFECGELLLAHGADVNAMTAVQGVYCAPLTLAVLSDQINWVKLLLRHGANVNFVGGAAAIQVDGEQWRSLKCLTRSVDYRPGNEVKVGTTALMVAITSRNMHCVKLLLEAGADVNQADSSGMRPLKLCCEFCLDVQKLVPLMKLLLAAGANVNMSDRLNIHRRQMDVLLPLLFAAGEEQVVVRLYEHPTRFYPPDWDDLDLMNQCRKVIRKYLLTLDPHTNLFMRIPQIGFPTSLAHYLLYSQDLRVDWEELHDESVRNPVINLALDH